jgi:prepilin-type N-terminal cleavage/methylation domain-containing protein
MRTKAITTNKPFITGGALAFTLVEVLVATAVLAVVVSGAALALMSANRMSSLGTSRNRIEAMIDEDSNKLKDAANRYTYCSGAYTWDGATCNGVGPGDENYYFPSTTTSTTNAEDFARDCGDPTADPPIPATMVDSLVTAIEGGDSTLALSAEAITAGISRNAAVDDDDPVDGENDDDGEYSHRIRVTYSATGLSSERRVLIIPPVAAWCP